MQVDLGEQLAPEDGDGLGRALGPAVGLALLTLLTKFITGWVGAARSGVGLRGRVRAGAMLTPRGEFSIAIAGLATAAGVVGEFEALAISYVFVLAVGGPILIRFVDPLADLFVRSRAEPRTGAAPS